MQFTTTALKALKKAPAATSARIMDALEGLAVSPFEAQGVKKLSAREEYRLRVGDWRVLYTLDNNILVVLVVDVPHRREVYR